MRCEQVIKVLTRSTSSEKAAPGEPPWCLDMFQDVICKSRHRKGSPSIEYTLDATDEPDFNDCTFATVYCAPKSPGKMNNLRAEICVCLQGFRLQVPSFVALLRSALMSGPLRSQVPFLILGNAGKLLHRSSRAMVH